MNSYDQLLLRCNADYVDSLYQAYLNRDPELAEEWRLSFEEDERAQEKIAAEKKAENLRLVEPTSSGQGYSVAQLVDRFRHFGHRDAKINPLADDERFGPRSTWFPAMGAEDLNREVTSSDFLGINSGTVREYIDALAKTYCGAIGVEYMDLDDEQREWMRQRIEPGCNQPNLQNDEKKEVLKQLVAADGFEETVHRIYTGAKRFSLEGGATLIPLLNKILTTHAENQGEQVVIGMAHRGRLNVLAHVMNKPLEYILAEFEDRPLSEQFQDYGDVKYHQGYSSDIVHKGQNVHLSLAFNPSHLEISNSVIQGVVRAKQKQGNDPDRQKTIPISIHGDAAFCGQGIVAETFTLSALRGYQTGGTLHVIVNNQIGFTADPDEARSTLYASDVARSIRAPIFHVNGDRPEAVVRAAQLAYEYRQRFGGDVVIDLLCYRRWGHNELDDATYTQPLMAKRIAAMETTSRKYAKTLVEEGVISEEEYQAEVEFVQNKVRDARREAKTVDEQFHQSLGGVWKGLKAGGEEDSVHTEFDRDRLNQIAESWLSVPEGFNWHKRLHRIVGDRVKKVVEAGPIDWATAESLAIGSLLLEGTSVRFSGQDAVRGTFSQRHAGYSDLETGEKYLPLNYIQEEQATLEVINSPVSEEAVLAFEYGYSSAEPWSLVIWEAQFGDFANGAQAIVDQLISSGEFKWGRMVGLVMLLPHGLEGQGPEHSSGRIERYLELCAEDNLQVCNATTPAQYFHVLRRQMKRDFRRPLVLFTPKSLLRHKAAVSTVDELTSGRFHEVLDDPKFAADEQNCSDVTRVLLCSGKVYYDLLEEREQRGKENSVAIVRLEQYYPFPQDELTDCLQRYANMSELLWVQEEPRNMGGYRHLLHRIEGCIDSSVRFEYAGRESRAVPATGSPAVHKREQAGVRADAFRDLGEHQESMAVELQKRVA